MNNLVLMTVVNLIAAITMLSVALVLGPTVQQANAQSTSFTFSQNQNNRCSGFAGCGNSGTITFTPIGPTPPPCAARVCA